MLHAGLHLDGAEACSPCTGRPYQADYITQGSMFNICPLTLAQVLLEPFDDFFFCRASFALHLLHDWPALLASTGSELAATLAQEHSIIISCEGGIMHLI